MKKLDVLQIITFFIGSILFGIGVDTSSIFLILIGFASMTLSVLNEIEIIKATKLRNQK